MNVSYEKTRGSDEWYTPKYIIDSLPKFDLDPCGAPNRIFDTAYNYYTKEDNGLDKNWFLLVIALIF